MFQGIYFRRYNFVLPLSISISLLINLRLFGHATIISNKGTNDRQNNTHQDILALAICIDERIHFVQRAFGRTFRISAPNYTVGHTLV